MSRRPGRAVQIDRRAESLGDGGKVTLRDSHCRCHDGAGVHACCCHDAVGAYVCPDQPREGKAQAISSGTGASHKSRTTSDTVPACGHHQRQLQVPT